MNKTRRGRAPVTLQFKRIARRSTRSAEENLTFHPFDRARCAVAESTEVMYAAIEERIDVLVSRTKYPCRYLVIMGGVLINSDHDVGSFCSLRRLICIDTAAGRRADWLDEFLVAAATLNGPSLPAASGHREARRMR